MKYPTAPPHGAGWAPYGGSGKDVYKRQRYVSEINLFYFLDVIDL